MNKENYDNNTQAITRFTKEAGYEFLSNFFSSTVRFDGALYPTVEHAYQASKSLDPKVREVIRRAKDPMTAKKLGKGIQLREDWEDEKIKIMKSLIREKFQNPFLQYKLIETKNRELVMHNMWNDRFWGVSRGVGKNWLGKILMEVRDELIKQAEEEKTYTAV